MLGILTCIRRLTGLCLQVLHHHFVAWTKSDTTSYLLVALTDLARSKSELVAENVFLRKPPIIQRRLMIQPACTTTDGLILVFWRRRAGTWKQVRFIVMENDACPLVVSEYDSSALLPLLYQGNDENTSSCL